MSKIEILELVANGLKCDRCGSTNNLYVVTHCKDGVHPSPASIEELEKFDKEDLRIHCHSCCVFDRLDVMAAYYGNGKPDQVIMSQSQYNYYKKVLCA